jgi:ferrous iron transport protein A
MTLLNGQIGTVYIVRQLKLNDNTKRRLQALGLTEGTKVSVLNNKKNGSVIFKVRGTRLAIGARIADLILVKEVH